MTSAQRISDELNNNGQQWVTDIDETSLETLCQRLDADYWYSNALDLGRSEFADGSAIISNGACWDLRADDCEEWCMAGIGCTCIRRAVQS